MKIYQIIFLLVFSLNNLTAQNNVSLNIAAGKSNISSNVDQKVELKLTQLASKNGFAGSNNNRFVLYGKLNVLQEELTATVPANYVMKYELILFIGDGIDGKIYSSYSKQLAGVGKTKDLAITSGLNRLSSSDVEVLEFLNEGRGKIIDYWNSSCDAYLNSIKSKSGNPENYNSSIYELSLIPIDCSSCYSKANEMIAEIYQQKIDSDCQSLLQQAKNAWNAGLNFDAAESAMDLLSSIDPNASCFSEIDPLCKDIQKRLLEIDSREWKYQLNEQQLEKDRIKAARDIGVAYGNNQPDTVVYSYYSW